MQVELLLEFKSQGDIACDVNTLFHFATEEKDLTESFVFRNKAATKCLIES